MMFRSMIAVTGFAALVLAPAASASAQTAAVAPQIPVQVPTVEAQTPAPQPQTQPVPAPPVSQYLINPGDELEVYTWGEERLQRSVKVLPDGTFSFPLVGQILAKGRRSQDIEALIVARLRDQYRGQVPQVTVSVKSPAGLQFSVMGKVRSPGTFTPGRYVSLIEALSLAGGPADFANLDEVLLIRKAAAGVRATRVRLGGLFKSGNVGSAVEQASSINIESGDTVIVP